MQKSRYYYFAIILIIICTTILSCSKQASHAEDMDKSESNNTDIAVPSKNMAAEDPGAIDDVRANAYKNSNSVRKQSANIYHLIDPQTQMQILQYKHPDGWVAGGNAQWTPNNPNMSHTWFAWSASPDGLMKFTFSSNIQMEGRGRVSQNPILTDPNLLARQLFIPAAQKDYNLTDITIQKASFAIDPEAEQKQQQIALEMTKSGLQATEIYCVDYGLHATGFRDGKPFFVSYFVPMNIVEMKPGNNYTHTMEMVQVSSSSGPAGSENEVFKIKNEAVSTIETNPNFIQFQDQVAQMQTQQAIAEINKNYEIMHQRHLQNIPDKWDEYIKDVDMVQNPNDGSNIYIDNRYDHAWINSDNEIMYMDSINFNPNDNSAFNNREWKRIR